MDSFDVSILVLPDKQTDHLDRLLQKRWSVTLCKELLLLQAMSKDCIEIKILKYFLLVLNNTQMQEGVPLMITSQELVKRKYFNL